MINNQRVQSIPLQEGAGMLGAIRRWQAGLIAALMVWCTAGAVLAGDWPQILGPNRNGIAVDETLHGQRAKAGWTFACGSGFAGVAVADGVAVLFHRAKGRETLTGLRADSGEELWNRSYPCTFRAQIVDDDGPRATPAIQGGRVVAYGVQGRLYCLDLKTGEEFWTRETHQDYQAPEGYFGVGSSPLIAEGLVVVNVGAPKNGGVVAFDLATGKTVWQQTNELASYSAPVVVSQPDSSQLLVITRLNFLGLELKSGKEQFRIPFGSRGPTVNAALPVVQDHRALLTASYGIGARLIEFSGEGAKTIWEDEVLSSQYTTPILHQGLVYGIDGRQDGGPVTLKCFDLESRQVRWSKSDLEYGTLVAADGKLLLMHTNGELRIAELNGQEYRELHQQTLTSGTTRALPALSRGRLYVRSETELMTFDLR